MEGDVSEGHVSSSGTARWPETSIIWQNAEHTVTLLDIPHSIELAQGFEENERRSLISVKPLEEPYAATEPKSKKAIDAIPSKTIDELILERTLQLALDDARRQISGKWCLERVVCSRQDNPVQKDDERSRRVLAEENGSNRKAKRRKVDSHQLKEAETLCNPPDSKAICGTITDHLPSFIADPILFDIVLLDPPWPNRSARRASPYHTSLDIKRLLSSLPLENKLADNGLIAIWITNRAAFRDLVLGKDGEWGLFEKWGVELVEEWVWLKVAANGEPVTAIDGVWRKPYEILLLGRRKTAQAESEGIRRNEVKRRIILAVPELHSRKPNLKELLEPMVMSVHQGKQPRCLEIFARNLTADWTSWGDEVLKLQDVSQWSAAASSVCNEQYHAGVSSSVVL